MASAGRILIMPKGNYDSSATYEMLDLVYYNGTSWLAKKTVSGIEPSEANEEYWFKMIGIVGYLPLSGGKLTGHISFDNERGMIYANDVFSIFEAKKDNQNYRQIKVANPTTLANVNDWVKVTDCETGTVKNYRLFGEHNIDLLKPHIEQIIAEYLNKNS